MLQLWEDQGEVPATVRSRLLACDMEALGALFSRRVAPPNLEDVPAMISVPALVIGGELDPMYEGILKLAADLPRGSLVSLPGVNHLGSLLRSDLTVPAINAFLAEVDRAS